MRKYLFLTILFFVCISLFSTPTSDSFSYYFDKVGVNKIWFTTEDKAVYFVKSKTANNSAQLENNINWKIYEANTSLILIIGESDNLDELKNNYMHLLKPAGTNNNDVCLNYNITINGTKKEFSLMDVHYMGADNKQTIVKDTQALSPEDRTFNIVTIGEHDTLPNTESVGITLSLDIKTEDIPYIPSDLYTGSLYLILQKN